MLNTYRSRSLAAAAVLMLTLSAATTAMAEDKPVPIMAPIVQTADKLTIEGVLEFNDLEGGFYQVGGYGLIGDEQMIKGLAGRQVIVVGKEFTGMSTRMTKQLEVQTMMLPMQANHAVPAAVTVNGKATAFDQAPVAAADGTLMLPLRAVVEAAGGTVEWDGATRTVTVSLPDRTAMFVIGQNEAELNMRGVFYIRRNMIAMDKAPTIAGGRTLISADAAYKILGLAERVDADQNLDLQAVK